MNEHELRHRLDALTRDEPPLSSTTDDILAHGQRRLRRHRIATGAAGTLGASAVAVAGVGVAMSQGTATAPGFAGAPSPTSDAPHAEPSPVEAPTADETQDALQVPDELMPEEPYTHPKTRELLYAVALEHFDPEGDNLGFESRGGGVRTDHIAEALSITNKLDWTNPDESGMGLVEVGVSTPGVDAAEMAMDFGCIDFPADCPEQQIPGTEESAYVVDREGDSPFEFAVIHERPDGSFTGVAVHSLFGNNSEEPVSDVGIELEQAFAFVTDDRLQVHPDERELDAPDGPRRTGTRGSMTQHEPSVTPAG